jgi:riboflavin kinase / FMN adenylyltransferase
MEVLHHPGAWAPPAQGSVVTIGAYDGIHSGHRQLIGRVLAQAEELGAAAGVVTFDQHPAAVVRPESAPSILTDQDQKLELLAETGVDFTVVVHFDDQRVVEPPEDFVRELLVDRLNVKAVVVGHDFHFGYKRRGDVTLLQHMGAELDFDVTGVHLFTDHEGGAPVSSTRIRQLLAEGDVRAAATLLGRPHQVRGVVGHGDQRGRELNFPTANVALSAAIALPADGVYAGWYQRPDGIRRPAALSLGRRPTFYTDAELSLLEAYLLDFQGDLYDEPARVEFVAHLRGQLRFESVDGLIAQMARDVEETREVLGREGAG